MASIQRAAIQKPSRIDALKMTHTHTHTHRSGQVSAKIIRDPVRNSIRSGCFANVDPARLRFNMRLSNDPNSHPGQLSLAIPPWVGAMSTGDG